MAENACENADLSKTVLREGMTIAEVGDPTKNEFSPYQRYKYLFRWDPRRGQQCSGSCGDSSKPEMAKTGASKFQCGTASYKIEDKVPLKVTCCGKAIGAPRGATSLDKAIEEWCTDNDSRSIKKGESARRRWDITEYGVTARNSFWLRGAITCGDEERMKSFAINEGSWSKQTLSLTKSWTRPSINSV
ncbi:hypothetical protein GQ44DRAFT_764925 [Phaeosphaeriaceae sp. PMI808]|nr:hypothetical protein GQ44DRAFT_764925 [Phaeosphaeriaceae sp. PMI808]